MSFKPKSANNGGGNGGEYVQRNYPVPKGGPRRARVSLIVDLGVQEREDFDIGKPTQKPQKPCQQVAVFADLVNDVVDYGGDVGEAHYRLMLNGVFKGVLKGINFAATPPKDIDGNTIEGKKWGFHDLNILTKVARAIGKPEIQETMDISELLNGQFMADVDVKIVPSGKNDSEGNEIVYKNVNFKGAAKVAPVMKLDENGDETGDEMVPKFAALKVEPKCITFENATKEDVKWIRSNLIKVIKLAHDYPNSAMQKAIEAYEAENGKSTDSEPVEKEDVAPAKAKSAPKAPAKPKKEVPQDAIDDDIPF